MCRAVGIAGIGALLVAPAFGGVTEYNNRATFEAQLGTVITDGYDDPDYLHGDVLDLATLDIHSDAQMSSIFGETDYRTTGFANWNIIQNQTSNPNYCAGCNGSFELSFTTTSVGDVNGVFGVGIDLRTNSTALPYHAYITLGDGSNIDIALPTTAGFWGVTSSDAVKSIHFGLENGGSTTNGSFVMDNLTIGNGIPAPGAIALLGIAGFARRRA